MDKAGVGSKAVLLAVVLATALLIGGCETAKGFASGIASTAEGVGKDGYNLWNFMKRADGWMTDNMW